MYIEETGLTVKEILADIERRNIRECVYIILGESGTTGKTWLCLELEKRGFLAFEITENIFETVFYADRENHYIVDAQNKKVVVILNKMLTTDYKFKK